MLRRIAFAAGFAAATAAGAWAILSGQGPAQSRSPTSLAAVMRATHFAFHGRDGAFTAGGDGLRVSVGVGRSTRPGIRGRALRFSYHAGPSRQRAERFTPGRRLLWRHPKLARSASAGR